jgi:hypothetical protein
MTARMAVAGGTLKAVTHLPRQVLFEKEGKPVVYVREGAGFTAVPVKVARITESRIIVENFDESREVALVNPETSGSGRATPTTGPIPGGTTR